MASDRPGKGREPERDRDLTASFYCHAVRRFLSDALSACFCSNVVMYNADRVIGGRLTKVKARSQQYINVVFFFGSP